jgi:hypothetical protein
MRVQGNNSGYSAHRAASSRHVFTSHLILKVHALLYLLYTEDFVYIWRGLSQTHHTSAVLLDLCIHSLLKPLIYRGFCLPY